MSKIYLMSTDTVKNIWKGALGAATFGAYHQYTTNKIMELNNEILNTKYKDAIERMETSNRKEMDELNQKYKQLEELVNQKNKWF